jgi:hypothetical protein
MLSFSISYSDLLNFLYFADTTTDLEGIGGERDGDFTDNSIAVRSEPEVSSLTHSLSHSLFSS